MAGGDCVKQGNNKALIPATRLAALLRLRMCAPGADGSRGAAVEVAFLPLRELRPRADDVGLKVGGPAEGDGLEGGGEGGERRRGGVGGEGGGGGGGGAVAPGREDPAVAAGCGCGGGVGRCVGGCCGVGGRKGGEDGDVRAAEGAPGGRQAAAGCARAAIHRSRHADRLAKPIRVERVQKRKGISVAGG